MITNMHLSTGQQQQLYDMSSSAKSCMYQRRTTSEVAQILLSTCLEEQFCDILRGRTSTPSSTA